MNVWRSNFRAVVEPSLGLSALLALCLLVLPLYAAPAQHTPKPTSSGMDAPPPAVLESFRALGSWGSAERRVLGAVPQRFSLETPALLATGSRLPLRHTPAVTKDTLALQGQWRLEGG